METMINIGCLSFNSMHHDMISQSQDHYAIRRFCPARVKQEQQICWEEEEDTPLLLLNDHIEPSSWSPSDIETTSGTPRLATFEEEEEFVDSFLINMDYDCYTDDNNVTNNNKHDDQAVTFNDQFQRDEEEIQNFSALVDDVVYGDDHEMEMMMMSSYFEDSEAVFSEMFPATTTADHGQHDQMSSSQCHALIGHGHDGVVVDQGLQLVHLLLGCAEAVGCRDTQLADSILTQIWPSVTPLGDSLQRVSYCFAMGLKSRLSLLQNNLNANGTFMTTNTDTASSLITREEKAEAFRLLHQTTPYIEFGFMAANDAISHAAKGQDSLHIIDLGMQRHLTLQWPSLIRTLASRSEGPPKSLRITAILGGDDDDQTMMINLLDLRSSVQGLIDESTSLGIPLEFHVISEPATPSLLTKEKLNLREGEALFVNSIMHLHKYVKESRGSLKTILQSIKKLRPTLLTVVELDANHNGPFFLGRFLESLHYYSAIFDSLEASMPRDSPQRTKIEILHFAEEIRNIVACEGVERRERHERADQWRRQLGRAGFQIVGGDRLKGMVSQARRMVMSVYGCDGYSLAIDKSCLLLGWKGRPIMLASAWQVTPTH